MFSQQQMPIRICEIDFLNLDSVTPHLPRENLVVVQDQEFKFAASINGTKNSDVDLSFRIGTRTFSQGNEN